MSHIDFSKIGIENQEVLVNRYSNLKIIEQ